MAIIIRRPVPNIVFLGDSITQGTGTSSPTATSYAGRTATAKGLQISRAVNMGVPSQGAEDLPDPDFLLDIYNENLLYILGGTNNIWPATNAKTGAVTWGYLSPKIAAAIASGWKVIVGTLTGVVGGGAGPAAEAAALATLIRANVTHVMDFAAAANIGATPNGAYFNDDRHPNDTGATAMAAIAAAVSPPFQRTTTVPTAAGIVVDSHTKMWLRDWYDVSGGDSTRTVQDKWYNLAPRPLSRTSGYVTASGNFATSVLNVLNGKPVVRFPGNAYYVTSGQSWANYITASAFTFEVILKVTSVSTTSATVYSNHGIIADTNNCVGLFVKSDGAGGAQIQGYVNDGGVKATPAQSIPIGSFVRVRMTLSGGTLTVAVGASSQSIASGNVSSLVGAVLVGVNPTTSVFFTGDIANLAIMDNVDGSRATTNNAHYTARFGV